MKLLTVIGARPQFIKASPVSRALKKAGIEEYLLHTGQHFDENMSQIFFEEMEIPQPDFNLGIHSLSHAAMTGKMMIGIENILKETEPDMLLVYGDTNSTLAGALAAKKLLIPVAHVEAGLRSYNQLMPEEINRVATDSISDFLFCPTTSASGNLINEGYSNELIHQVGDVMYDALLHFSPKARPPQNLAVTSFVLCTLHRQENTDNPSKISGIIDGINQVAEQTPVIFPVHPRTKQIVKDFRLHSNIYCIEPVGYLEMLHLLKSCSLVMTDSGGLQKEAFFSKKFCITMRAETEWVELVDGGYNILAGASPEKILAGFQQWYGRTIQTHDELYGAGDAADHIARILSTS